jgi:fatty-acyl-CoA synthase
MLQLTSFLDFHARRAPDRLAIVYRDQRLSYGALQRRVGRLAALLAARGIGTGDVVAALMKNSCGFVELAFAVSHLGAVFLPINYRLAAEEVRYVADDAEAKLLVADAEFADTVTDLPAVLLLDEAAQSDPGRVAGAAARMTSSA